MTARALVTCKFSRAGRSTWRRSGLVRRAAEAAGEGPEITAVRHPLLPLRGGARRGTQTYMFGITLRARNAANPFWELVDKASAFETTPSIRALGYSPHITLARCPAIETARLIAAAEVFDGEAAFGLTFERIEAFDTEPLVLWLKPSGDQRLIDAHARLHAALDPTLCDTHYRPGNWRPHLTIAMAIAASQRQAALDIAKRPFKPFTLTFDVVDCLSWPPVSILQTRRLDQERFRSVAHEA